MVLEVKIDQVIAEKMKVKTSDRFLGHPVDSNIHLNGTYPSLDADLSQPFTSLGLSRILPSCRPEKSMAT